MQSDNLTKSNAYGMNKDLVCQKKEIECNDIMKQNKIVYFLLY